jgi:hypothetical protein
MFGTPSVPATEVTFRRVPEIVKEPMPVIEAGLVVGATMPTPNTPSVPPVDIDRGQYVAGQVSLHLALEFLAPVSRTYRAGNVRLGGADRCISTIEASSLPQKHAVSIFKSKVIALVILKPNF